MFALLESGRTTHPFLASSGSIASIAAHVLLVGGALMATSGGQSLAPEGITESIVYIAPPKRKPVSAESEGPIVFARDGRSLEEGVDGDLVDNGLLRRGGGGAGAATVGTGAQFEEKIFIPVPVREAPPVFSVSDVDQAAARDSASAAPQYPQSLLRQGVEGATVVQFVVDATGEVDLASFKEVDATHALFTLAVYAALPRMKYRPATIGGRPVRQLVEQEFKFRIIPG
jgi:TonB family protein